MIPIQHTIFEMGRKSVKRENASKSSQDFIAVDENVVRLDAAYTEDHAVAHTDVRAKAERVPSCPSRLILCILRCYHKYYFGRL